MFKLTCVISYSIYISSFLYDFCSI
jgi:hypothetical protein